MKEIGGYFSLECEHHAAYHQNTVALNSGRNALRYIIRVYGIRSIYTPIYTCPVVWDAIAAENCKIIPYDVDNDFMPVEDIPDDAFFLYNNYFGICGNNIKELSKRYKNLIVDNAQAFYMKNQSLGAIYSPRKFFGLPDGGLAVCDKEFQDTFDTAISYDLCGHLLKRIDMGANAGYTDFQKNDKALIDRPVQKMSKLTTVLMGNIDYEHVKQQRLNNFAFLHKTLADKNEINIVLSDNDVPMVYPFKTTDIGLRAKLIENKIFVAKYWPAEGNGCMKSNVAQMLAEMIVPLPIDQRYDESDMEKIVKTIG